jgi:hypothetical protein
MHAARDHGLNAGKFVPGHSATMALKTHLLADNKPAGLEQLTTNGPYVSTGECDCAVGHRSVWHPYRLRKICC